MAHSLQITSNNMILSLLRQSCYASVKSIPQHYRRGYSWSFASRKCPPNSWCHQYPSVKVTSIKFNQGIYRSFMTHEHLPTERSNRIARQDAVPNTYELIYSIPIPGVVRFGHYFMIILACCGGYVSIQMYLFPRDGPTESIKMGAFDDEQMKGLDEDDVKYLLNLFFVGFATFSLIITKIPLRIYRSSTASERHYIAVYVNKILPWTISNHEFPSARKIKFNFITRYFFYLETYKLGNKRAIIFPGSFRSAYDHDEMIDFQLGKSMFDVKKEVEDYETYRGENRKKSKTS